MAGAIQQGLLFPQLSEIFLVMVYHSY